MSTLNGPDTELTPEEQAALTGSRTEYAPPVGVETRIVQEMRRRGLIARPPLWRKWSVAAGLVILAAVFTLGLEWKRLLPAPVSDSRPHFMLLLYEDAASRIRTAEDHAKQVKEYSDWARTLAQNGSLVSGDELATSGFALTPANLQGVATVPEEHGQLGGYFMVAARDESEALQIARTCPHMRYGGRVVVLKVLI